MIIPQVDRLSKGKLIALCTVVGMFVVFLAIGTTWGGGGGKVHTSPTGQCTVCHGTSLTTIHQVSWTYPDDRTGCYVCHPSGRRTLYAGLVSSFDCIKCHTLIGVPVAYHMDMDTKHTSTEEACMKCHSTGTIAEIPIAPLPEGHQGIGEEVHLPLTVDCPTAVATIVDDIHCYCLECHKNPVRIPTLPDNANCTSCHEAGEYNAKSNQCFHDSVLKALEEAGIDVTSHTTCTICHIKCLSP